MGVEVEFSKSKEEGFWRGIQEQLLAATLAGAPKYDCLIVDEGQDFKTDWYDILQMFLTDDATQLWLEDPLQNLRRSDPIELPGFVTYHDTVDDCDVHQGHARGGLRAAQSSAGSRRRDLRVREQR